MPCIRPGATTIVAPKTVGSRTTNGQMKAISLGEFNSFPGRRDGPNHADRLDRASRVLSARIQRKKPQAKKSPSVLSVETAYELTPSEESQKTKPAQNHFPEATAIRHIKRHNVLINHNRIEIYYLISITIERQSERPEEFDIVSIFRKCNRNLKTASGSTETFKPSLKTAIEMNEEENRPIDSWINKLSSST